MKTFQMNKIIVHFVSKRLALLTLLNPYNIDLTDSLEKFLNNFNSNHWGSCCEQFIMDLIEINPCNFIMFRHSPLNLSICHHNITHNTEYKIQNIFKKKKPILFLSPKSVLVQLVYFFLLSIERERLM